MLVCPLCRSAQQKSSPHAWKEYTWWDCPDCGIGFATPFKKYPHAGPGAAPFDEKWVRSGEDYYEQKKIQDI